MNQDFIVAMKDPKTWVIFALNVYCELVDSFIETLKIYPSLIFVVFLFVGYGEPSELKDLLNNLMSSKEYLESFCKSLIKLSAAVALFNCIFRWITGSSRIANPFA